MLCKSKVATDTITMTATRAVIGMIAIGLVRASLLGRGVHEC
jgi:hypothetical protein